MLTVKCKLQLGVKRQRELATGTPRELKAIGEGHPKETEVLGKRKQPMQIPGLSNWRLRGYRLSFPVGVSLCLNQTGSQNSK